jgi:glycosyltransferase involved in cell wall biosynthesis
MNAQFHICIVTTSHNITDNRIYNKQALSLKRAGYWVSIIAQTDKSQDEFPLEVFPLPCTRKHYKRYMLNSLRAFFIMLRIKADVYHLHDPELLIIGAILRILGKKVIFDSHENYYEKFKSNRLPKVARFLIGSIWLSFQFIVGRILSHVIVADSHTFKKFPKNKTTIIGGYPPLNIIDSNAITREKSDDNFRIVYSGVISWERGIGKIIDALIELNDNRVELHLVGPVLDVNLKNKIEMYPHTVEYGLVPWSQVGSILFNCDLGLALLQPVPAYLYCPGENIVKIFEYMAAELPFLISDFPKLKELVELNDCGIAVDPTSPKAIAEAIKYLFENPDVRKRMGENGKRAFLERFNWEILEKRLLKVYDTVLKKTDATETNG